MMSKMNGISIPELCQAHTAIYYQQKLPANFAHQPSPWTYSCLQAGQRLVEFVTTNEQGFFVRPDALTA